MRRIVHSFNLLLQKKAKAGVLSLVLSLSLVVALICASMILLAYTNRIDFLQKDIELKLQRNADSGLQYLLASFSNLEHNQPLVIDLYSNEEDSVSISKKPWGFFDIGLVTAFQGRLLAQSSAIIGSTDVEALQSAVYLADEGRPLSVAGNTRVVGKSYLPKSGVKSAYINRVGYSGKELIYGSVFKSESRLPRLNQERILQNEKLLTSFLSEDYYKLEEIDELISNMDHPFSSDYSLYFHSSGSLVIGQTLRGNIVIRSDRKVFLTASSELEDVIIVAPEVDVQSGFEGKVQILASNSISVGSHVTLAYPSVLAFVSNQPTAQITMEAESELHGLLLLSNQSGDYNKKLVKIEKDAKVIGQVYVDALVELSGQVLGNVTCRKFYLKTASSIYENHLFNAEIDNSKLPQDYVNGLVAQTIDYPAIAKWLE